MIVAVFVLHLLNIQEAGILGVRIIQNPNLATPSNSSTQHITKGWIVLVAPILFPFIKKKKPQNLKQKKGSFSLSCLGNKRKNLTVPKPVCLGNKRKTSDSWDLSVCDILKAPVCEIKGKNVQKKGEKEGSMFEK